MKTINIYPLLVACLWLICQGCNPDTQEGSIPSQSQEEAVRSVAEDFFATFADRSDWQKFCAFYREDMVFEDVLLQIKLDSLWQFKKFYKWDEEAGNFQKLTPEQKHLTIKTLVVNDSVAVGRGRFHPFYYYGELIDPDWGMEATIWLYFDEHLKIRKQVDWIEYDDRALEGVIRHYRANGADVLPSWLDLSRE